MKFVRTRFALLALIIFSLLSSGVASASYEEERMTGKISWEPEEISIEFSDPGASRTFLPSLLWVEKQMEGYGSTRVDRKICTSAPLSNCAIDGYRFVYDAIFSPCSTPTSLNCIESVWGTSQSGEKIPGQLVEEWESPNHFPGVPSLGLPAGGGSSTWRIPNSNGTNSDLFALVAGERGSMGYGKDDVAHAVDSFAYLQPVEILPLKYGSNTYTNFQYPDGPGTNTGFSAGDGANCFIFDKTRCAARATFSTSGRFGIKIRYQNPPQEWFRSRINNPIISVTKDSASYVVEISGEPLVVPFVTGVTKWSNLRPETQAMYPKSIERMRAEHGSSLWLGGESGKNALNFFSGWLPILNDKATAMKSHWTLNSINLSSIDDKMRRCSDSKYFAGIVSSNATVYSDGAPILNASSEALEYQVAAPHFDSHGEIFTGIYDLKIQSNVARCIYGFTDAPIKATISVTSESETTRTSTSSISESNGFLNFHIAGFSYSSPTIQVKLSQQSSTAMPSNTTPSAPVNTQVSPSNQTAINSKKAVKTILCERGKTLKKVSGTKPICPTGYKLKK